MINSFTLPIFVQNKKKLSKLRVYSLGLFTLLMVPAAWLLQWLPPLKDFFRLDELLSPWSLVGIGFGIFFGSVMLLFTTNQTAEQAFSSQIKLIRSFKLTITDTLFLSLCAGIGEEYLFRLAFQEWVHPLIVSVVFVAIHGYITPRDWDTTKFGLLVLVFIIVLGYGVSFAGLWFCILAHAAYDFVLLFYWSRYNSDV